MATSLQQNISREKIFNASLEFFLDPIKPYLQDETVTEVMVNGHEEIYIERRGQLEETNARFESADALLSAVHNIAQYVGREIDETRPVLDARLPDGSRVHAVIPPSARRGTYLTIRKFSKERLTLEDLLGFGSISEPANPFTSDQWAIKQSYATAANLQSRQLLNDAAQSRTGFQPVQKTPTTGQAGSLSYVDIFNTTSWPRSELALIPHELSEGANVVIDYDYELQ